MPTRLLELYGKACQLAHLRDCLPPQFLLCLLARRRLDVCRFAKRQDPLAIPLGKEGGSNLLGDGLIH
jgi:hypothetical protein